MPNPSPDEATARRDLAAAYRLAARRGWDDIVWTHISAALPGEPGAYLINRFGLRLGSDQALGRRKSFIIPHPG